MIQNFNSKSYLSNITQAAWEVATSYMTAFLSGVPAVILTSMSTCTVEDLSRDEKKHLILKRIMLHLENVILLQSRRHKETWTQSGQSWSNELTQKVKTLDGYNLDQDFRIEKFFLDIRLGLFTPLGKNNKACIDYPFSFTLFSTVLEHAHIHINLFRDFFFHCTCMRCSKEILRCHSHLITHCRLKNYRLTQNCTAQYKVTTNQINWLSRI